MASTKSKKNIGTAPPAPAPAPAPPQKSSSTESDKQPPDDTKWRELHGGMVAKMRVEKLIEAIRCKDKTLLNAAIEEARDQELVKHSEAMYQAEVELEVITVKEELDEAIKHRDAERIQFMINKITMNRLYHSRMQPDVAEASRHLGQILRIHKLGSFIMDMDRKTIGEMRRYFHPPELVHKVMKAILLLFKEDEERTQTWSVCQYYLQPNGPKGMNRKILEFDVGSVHPEIAARVDQLLGKIDLLKLQEVSSGAATFYVWAKGIVDAVIPKGSSSTAVQPADIRRQKEIFNPPPAHSPTRKRRNLPNQQQSPRNLSNQQQSPRKY